MDFLLFIFGFVLVPREWILLNGKEILHIVHPEMISCSSAEVLSIMCCDF